jgi:hypothetical protein
MKIRTMPQEAMDDLCVLQRWSGDHDDIGNDAPAATSVSRFAVKHTSCAFRQANSALPLQLCSPACSSKQ